MKTNYYFSIAFLLFGVIGFSQNIRLNAYASYSFQDRFDSYYDRSTYYEGKIKDGLQWGAGLEYMFHPRMGFELMYLRQDTNAPTYYQVYEDIGLNYANFDLGLNYILLAGNQYFRPNNSDFEGFGSLSAGMVIAELHNPDNGNSDTTTKFAWGAKLGGIYWMSSNIGIKLQLQLISAVQVIGGGFYFGYYGPSTGLSTYSTLYQFSLGGGLVVQL